MAMGEGRKRTVGDGEMRSKSSDGGRQHAPQRTTVVSLAARAPPASGIFGCLASRTRHSATVRSAHTREDHVDDRLEAASSAASAVPSVLVLVASGSCTRAHAQSSERVAHGRGTWRAFGCTHGERSQS